MSSRPVLAIDTATSRAVVALGDPAGRLLSSADWSPGQRHSEELLPRIDAMLRSADLGPRQLGGIVVGTGPGAFTGLRVGLATAKTLAHELDLPIAGVSSAEALLLAAQDAGEPGPFVLLLPAGSTDRLLVRPGRPAELLPGGHGPYLAAGEAIVAVDLADRADPESVARGEAALVGLATALVRLGSRRLSRGEADDVDQLVPEYVTLPRGVAAAAGEIAWSRDRR
jgi:tRNA threonylcarbamoyl adenosine modification protein YeaZ